MLDLTVIIPVRNAAHIIEACLESVINSEPREIIVVDGLSTDQTLNIVRRHPQVTIFSDEGRGVPAARNMGIKAASSPYVALIDADIVLPDGALAALFNEFVDGNYSGLQAGLHSVSGPGYWGKALVNHHRSGRSKMWPGVMATIFDRNVLLQYELDERFQSGEDIELRWRLQRSKDISLGVSHSTIVTHRYEDTFDFAKGQWLADGKGLGFMVSKYGLSALYLLGIPLAGALRGIALSLIHLRPKYILYYVYYAVFNYVAIIKGLSAGLSAIENASKQHAATK